MPGLSSSRVRDQPSAAEQLRPAVPGTSQPSGLEATGSAHPGSTVCLPNCWSVGNSGGSQAPSRGAEAHC